MAGFVSKQAIDLIESAVGAGSAAEVGRRFFAALKPYGVRAIYARCERSAAPGDVVTYSRISPPGWEAFYAQARYQRNFLTREMRRRIEGFRWTDVAEMTDIDRELMAALGSDFAIDDGLAVPVHGPGGYVGVTSLAFERMEALSPRERRAIAAAALYLHLRMRELTPAAQVEPVRLTPRERECLAYVADGATDWEIGERLGLAETTVITHVQSARRKLGAKTRAQAVALALLAGLI